MIRGVIFDFDNTLYDYNSIHTKALNTLFEALPLETPTIYEMITSAIKNSNNYNNNHNKIIYIKQILEHLHIPLTQLKKYVNIYESAFSNDFKLFDGVVELFQYLKSRGNIKIGICSNNNFISQLTKLETTDLLQYVDVIQTSDECGEAKPHMNMFLNLQHKMQVPFEDMVYIGDSFNDDIKPALYLKILPFHFICGSDWIQRSKYIEFGDFHYLLTFFTQYEITIANLIMLSKYFGQSHLNIQGQGGNISIKLDDLIFIKSSGSILGNISYTDGYCIANNKICMELLNTGNDIELKNTKVFGYKIPSMETFFHSFMEKYTIHIHFTLSNIFFCSTGGDPLHGFKYNYEIIPYVTPGILLAQEVLKKYSAKTHIYFLENHGLILTSNNIEDIFTIYEYIFNYFNAKLDNVFDKDWVSFVINRRLSRPLIIKHHPIRIKNITYCFPDLAIFVEKVGVFDNIDNFDNKMYDLIILNGDVYVCADTIMKVYGIIELLNEYMLLNNTSSTPLKSIQTQNITYLQNMEQEKYRK